MRGSGPAGRSARPGVARRGAGRVGAAVGGPALPVPYHRAMPPLARPDASRASPRPSRDAETRLPCLGPPRRENESARTHDLPLAGRGTGGGRKVTLGASRSGRRSYTAPLEAAAFDAGDPHPLAIASRPPRKGKARRASALSRPCRPEAWEAGLGALAQSRGGAGRVRCARPAGSRDKRDGKGRTAGGGSDAPRAAALWLLASRFGAWTVAGPSRLKR